MKYLSFITVLILLVTLFSFVFSQLNKDETKRHEYGIAFPLEESESRLPSLGSLLPPLSGDGLKGSELDSSLTGQEATTVPPTTTAASVAVGESKHHGRSRASPSLASVSEDENNSSEEQSSEKDTIPILLQSLVESAMQNESMKDSGASVEIDEDEEEEDGSDGGTIINSSLLNPTGSGNPKLVFIERLMGLNFQRPSPSADDFSSFLELNNDSSDSDKPASGASVSVTATAVSTSEVNNKTDDSADSNDKDSDSLWGTNSLDNLRSRWESRIRKFTLPFQNTYSVVLRASNGIDSASSSSGGISGSTEPESDSSDEQSEQQQQPPTMQSKQLATNKQQQLGSPINSAKFFISASSDNGGLNTQRSEQSELANENNAQQSQTNQLLRMAALSMMSKLFSAIRSQVYTNSKMDTGNPKIREIFHNELEMEDDDESENGEGESERGSLMEPIPVPIIIAQKPRMSFMADMSRQRPSGYGPRPGSYASYPGYQRDSRVYASDETPIRTTIMYGRPGNPMSMAHSHSSAHEQQLPPFASPSRFYASHQQPPMSPIGAILSAAIQAAASSSAPSSSSSRPNYYRRMESFPSMAADSPMEMSSGQPQRIILLITHRPSASESQPQIQMIQREEPSYQSAHSMQPNFVQYSPLSVPSSPVYYHYQHANNEPTRAQIQIRPQVVEVPVPVYLPMHARAREEVSVERNVGVSRPVLAHPQRPTMIIKSVSSGSVPAATAAITLPRSAVPIHSPIDYPHHHHHHQQPHHQQYSSAPQQSQSQSAGHVALVYYHSPESKESGLESNGEISQPQAQMSMDVAQHIAPASAQAPSADDSDEMSTTGVVRIMLRPRHIASGIPLGMSSAASRFAYHRRSDAEQANNNIEEDSDDGSEDSLSMSGLSTGTILSELLGGNLGISAAAREGSRLRQWRDYTQSSRAEQQQSPLIINGGGNNGAEAVGSMQALSSSAPMAHIFIAASPARNPEQETEHESSPSEEHHYIHHYHPASSPIGQPQPSHQQLDLSQQQQGPMVSPLYYSNMVPSSFSSASASSAESDASPMEHRELYYRNHQQQQPQQSHQHQAPVAQQQPQPQQNTQSHFFIAPQHSPVYESQQQQVQQQQQQQIHQFIPQHHLPSQYQPQVSAQINVNPSPMSLHPYSHHQLQQQQLQQQQHLMALSSQSQMSSSSSGSASASEPVSVSVPLPQQHQQNQQLQQQQPIGRSAAFLIMSPDPNSSIHSSSSSAINGQSEQSNSSNDS